ncbi:carbohydrate ABC transporter permease [Cohnella silvisoli]|uniref:Sugar ABC transporter permease n=1 Tax=Cohnella silvisoli TaxID=2873699 RepID=A0ABV1KU11_9BACL|nr:sugar ABC transporter permease [Cohnella silvisoli]MCD9023230.1 sugar ABC transporter permease [Cohnella silvisoli]
MERLLRNKTTILMFILPALIIYSIVLPLPAVSSVYFSLVEWNLIDTMRFVGLDNFSFLFLYDDVFYAALKNTFIYLLLSIALQLPMAFFLAIILSKAIKGRRFFRNVIFLPVTFSGVAVSLMWYFIYHSEVGLVNRFLEAVGLGFLKHSWLADGSTALYAVIICVAWQFVGYHMVIYMAGISTIPADIVEAAKMDGAGEWHIIKHIMFPYLIPMLKVSTILMTTSSLKSFDNIYIMTQGGPNHATEVLASHMYTKAFAQMEYGYGSALSTALMALCISATVLLNRLFRRDDFDA